MVETMQEEKQASTFTPTVGRIVHYYGKVGSNPNHDIKQPLAALVTRVWNETCVNLAVWDEDGQANTKTSVTSDYEGNESWWQVPARV